MSNTGTKRLTAILAVIMIVAIGGGTILQLFTNNSSQSVVPTVAPATPTVLPTFPPPITDLNTISFSGSYLHPSGLFSVAQPTGWSTASPVSNANGVEVTMNNINQLSVIQDSLQIASEPITSLDQLDALYTTASLNESWSNYRRDSTTGLNYRETGRRREGDQLILDFELKNQRQQTFVARQVAWSDGEWVYSVRVVTPENAIDELKYLIDNIVPTFKANKMFAGTPPDWQSYFDPTYNLIIRYPSTWTLTDSAPGRPASIAGDNDEVLRIESLSGVSAADEAAASAWVESSRSGVSVASVEPTTRGDLSGSSVAYTFTDADGAPQSGLAVLLNGANDTLHVANLRFTAANVDLNADEAATGQYSNLVSVLNTFQVLQGVTIVLPTPTPSFTPPPPTATLPATETQTPTNTPVPSATSTPTATFTATNTTVPSATPTNTPEPSATRRPTNTPRPTNTVEPTEEATAEATEGS
jgi:hypothetical protein